MGNTRKIPPVTQKTVVFYHTTERNHTYHVVARFDKGKMEACSITPVPLTYQEREEIHKAAKSKRAAWQHEDMLIDTHFGNMATLYEAILTVQKEHRPQMLQFGIVFPSDEKQAIATVWIGAGADSSPEKRIKELFDENAQLRAIIEHLNAPK